MCFLNSDICAKRFIAEYLCHVGLVLLQNKGFSFLFYSLYITVLKKMVKIIFYNWVCYKFEVFLLICFWLNSNQSKRLVKNIWFILSYDPIFSVWLVLIFPYTGNFYNIRTVLNMGWKIFDSKYCENTIFYLSKFLFFPQFIKKSIFS